MINECEWWNGNTNELSDGLKAYMRRLIHRLSSINTSESDVHEKASCILKSLYWFEKQGIDINNIIEAEYELGKTRIQRHGNKAL